ncbi:hypothetical protein MCHLDSM_05131 [Mycolicibacterium chlorophenolicum]|uniref:Uncharacterized protein n=1 Tax=Mycolicibacterium chlorophenolicum TaxID=37916 RepID=A0A0J6VL97_9MYCO|nr:hypothetical protein MCHLDSM_05131 [Mycolicibacterium chlorophenolicum]
MAGRSGRVCGEAFSAIVDIVADDARFSVDDALDRLYAARPEDFTAQRTQLAAEAKRSGDAAAAKQISGSRKPTVAAWVANLLALRGTARASLADLGARLREAHAAMDGEAIRTLTGEQRRLVDELSRAGFLAAGVAEPSAALRDDVTATLQAAVADPDVAARLGRLTKAEQWSGFGEFGTVTAVSAKRAPAPAKAAPAKAADKKADDERAREARAALAAAEHRKSEADAALTELQSDLARARLRADDARRRLADAEQAVTAAEDAYAAGKRESGAATAAVKAAKSTR